MPHHPMIKREREIADKAVVESIIRHGKFTVLALCRSNEPYVVTLSYGYDDRRKALYFHTAHKGLKLEFLSANPAACATVIEDPGYIMGECTHAYRSVVLYGTVVEVKDLAEKKHGLDVMLRHLEDDPETVKKKSLKDDAAYDRAAILRFDIADMTGKEGR
jgi:uncharacterized protein